MFRKDPESRRIHVTERSSFGPLSTVAGLLFDESLAIVGEYSYDVPLADWSTVSVLLFSILLVRQVKRSLRVVDGTSG